MSNTYNIYSVIPEKFDDLLAKLKSVGLEEQKTSEVEGYKMTFYFSENLTGNEVWWWGTYKDFFNDDVKEPKNFFYYGVLICSKNEESGGKRIYAVSLGKTHFYLSRFIQADFGIYLAARVADEKTLLLKKSRYFAGSKRQEVSSYQDFNTSYEPGESVDHLKLKAEDEELWGSRNIIFADSIQMDVDKSPSELPKIFEEIDNALESDEVISFPKLEPVDKELDTELDGYLFGVLRSDSDEVGVGIEEFYVSGITICFRFHDYSYKIYAKKPSGKGSYSKAVNGEIDIDDIRSFLKEHEDIADANSIKVQFQMEGVGKFSKNAKELLDIPATYKGENYFLRNGSWYRFNQVFMDYLKNSLESIDFEKGENLIEEEYVRWREEKELRIARGENVDNNILYREFYFNSKLCDAVGFTLMDRVLEQLNSLRDDRSKYKVEVADIYKDEEVISLKISKENQGLIYNIEQSKTAVELIKRGEIAFDNKISSAGLWFVFEKEVNSITEINSIQFLLAIESWKKMLGAYGITPKIYVSQHIK